MSKEKSTKQMSLQGDFLANHSALQEKENQQQMIVISGMKCLESLEKQNQDGLLEKMLKALLISTKAWYSDRCLMTWKTKVSKANVLLFQLQASVRGIKEKESGSLERMWRTPTAEGDAGKRGLGKMTTLEAQQKNRTVTLSRQMRDVDQGIIKSPSMYPTPTTMDHIDRKGMRPSRAATNRKTGYLSEMIKMYPTPTQDSASERTKKYSQGGIPLSMAVKMFPTPRARDYFPPVNPNQVYMNEQGWTSIRKKTGVRYGATLPDVMNKIAVQMLPTPTHSEHKYRLKGNTQASKCLEAQARRLGGKLNPHFVEFLMGFPMNWTKIDPTE